MQTLVVVTLFATSPSTKDTIMRHIIKTTALTTLASMSLFAGVALADGNSNVCRPNADNAEIADTVNCTWAHDPTSNPLPDVSNCQEHLRAPASSDDDCGNAEYKQCMENLGFQCATIHTDGE
jgi:hypothetical protein